MSPTIEPEIVDPKRRSAAVARLRQIGRRLPTFSDLADPIAAGGRAPDLKTVDPDAPDAANLWRVNWFNDESRTGRVELPGHLVLPSELTGVKAPIVVLIGDRFPMIGAHKVLPAYACLMARLVTGRFDPAADRAIWPSTGNYCRGGVAISRILGCRGVAVLPAGMSRERFDWLQHWVTDPADVIRTPGTESNVKEIYDKCGELSKDPENVILNQFSEFANYVIHHHCTGTALDRVFASLAKTRPSLKVAAFVSATGSAGTIAAGDFLKDRHGSKIVAVEATECPTLLENGFGEHNIQGIGDKHVPLIHNVMNTDVVIGVSDLVSDSLNLLFGSDVGQKYLAGRRKIDPALVAAFAHVGISGLANIAASIKLAKHFDYGPNDVILTVATDGAALYHSERDSFLARRYPDGFDEVNAGEIFGRHLEGLGSDHLLELTHVDRKRIFNLGYYTWVEQQGVSLADFERRRSQEFWRALVDDIPTWDRMIDDFNAEVSGTSK
ncbi:Cysteine synthase [Rhodovulum sp. PH10]|uniref:pyridoxal-phosphate dependent enzyme n=1 Tax=Rhodovulum sp. PH10 TaxID=1187851 RepID=UPI00027C235B|nr:pyridoxal-phosphate dependent enzyme [Rhodovulum sp. PH10]EJW12357.1 Cysteine synthase [Rhodovulum sp. PH10]